MLNGAAVVFRGAVVMFIEVDTKSFFKAFFFQHPELSI